MVKQHKMYINGEFVPALDGRTLAVYNPATEKAISEVPRGGADDAKIAIDAAGNRPRSLGTFTSD